MNFIEDFRIVGNGIKQIHLRFRILLGSLTVHAISFLCGSRDILVSLNIFHIKTDSGFQQQIFDRSEFQITTDKEVTTNRLIGNIQ